MNPSGEELLCASRDCLEPNAREDWRAAPLRPNVRRRLNIGRLASCVATHRGDDDLTSA